MIFRLMKKELYEFLKTGKLIAIVAVFLFFSILSPITAKIMPDLIKSMSMEITIIVPPPTWKDAFLQFSKNLNQIVFLVTVLLFIGSIAEEKNRKTATLVVSKGVDRREWVVAKFVFYFLLVFLLLWASFALCYYYSVILFPDTEFYSSFSSSILFLIYITFIISLTVFSSSIGNSMLEAGGIFISVFIALNILNIFPSVKPYNPMNLSSIENQWILSGVDWSIALKPVISSLLLSLILIFLGASYFNNQELE